MVEAEVEAATGKDGEQDAGAGAPPTVLRPPPCLLDQRLDERLELVAIDETTWAWRTGWRGDAQVCAPDTMTLL